MTKNISILTLQKPVDQVIQTFNEPLAIIMLSKLSDIYATVFHSYERDFDIIAENLGK